MGGQTTSQGMEDKLGLALNPNRAEMPGTKRKGSYDQVEYVPSLCEFLYSHRKWPFIVQGGLSL